MRCFVSFNKKGEIISLVETNDRTLVVSHLAEVKDEKLFREIEKDSKKFKVKEKKVVKKDDS